MKRIIPFFFATAVLSFFFFTTTSCKKDTEIITNTVYQTDTLIVTIQDTIILSDTINLTEFILDTVTTFILVKHADKEMSGTNPNLTMAGMERAEALKKSLKNIPLEAIYSTNYNRTMQTVEPVANDHSLSIETYGAFSLNPLIDEVIENYWGKPVLIVGHSNTVPDLLNLLLGNNIYPDIPESEYNNLYIVTVFEKGRAEVLHLKYGE